MFDEEGDVVVAIAQGRQQNREDVKAVVEVLAEGTVASRAFEVAVRGGEDTHVGAEFGAATDAAELALFEDAQELGLHVDFHLADFVEEEGATFGQLEASGAALVGTGEGSALVTEQFTFDQGIGNGGAVEDDEGAVAASGEIMNG